MDGMTVTLARRPVVRDLSARVQAGGWLGVIGPNGAGKTTLFNIITGHYRPTRGDVVFNGRSIVGHTSNQIVARAWGAALTLVVLVLILNLIARAVARRSRVA